MSTEEITENKNESTDNQEVEQEARLQGWVPKEEFRGDETDWVDATTFVKRGKEINPILKKNNERLLRELELTKKQMQELRSATEEFKAYQKEQYERKAVELQREIEILREEKKQAISSGDGEKVILIDDRIDELKEEKKNAEESSKETKKESTETYSEVAPEITDWIEKNKWYSSDVRMASVANSEGERIRRAYPNATPKEFFEELDKSLEEIFTLEKLGRKKKEKVRNPVEGTTNNGTVQTKDKRSYENLPSEAKAACDKFVKQKLMTREEYISSYQWD